MSLDAQQVGGVLALFDIRQPRLGRTQAVGDLLVVSKLRDVHRVALLNKLRQRPAGPEHVVAGGGGDDKDVPGFLGRRTGRKQQTHNPQAEEKAFHEGHWNRKCNTLLAPSRRRETEPRTPVMGWVLLSGNTVPYPSLALGS